MNSLISIKDLNRQQILALCSQAALHDKNKECTTLDGKIVMTLFFEPSTRTRLSFESAALRTGAKVLTFTAESSSLKKGESFSDTVRMASSYADILIIRHPEEGASAQAKAVSSAPVINAGDGKNEHPTQTMLDLYTIIKERGSIDGSTIALAGDLKYGRAVHSLLYALKNFDAKIILAAPQEFALPEDIKKEMGSQIIYQTEYLHEALEADFLYMTRVQKERFNPQAEGYKEDFILSLPLLEQKAKKSLRVLHPLPRVNEITEDVDPSPHNIYFKQAANGVPMRMALLEYASGVFLC